MIRPASLAVALAAAVVVIAPSVPAFAQNASGLPAKAVIPTSVPAIVPAVPTVAPGYAAPSEAAPSPHLVGVTQQPFVGITLQDAVGMALLRNPNLAISASNYAVSRFQIIETKAPFDLRFQVQPSSSFSVEPPQNAFFAGPGSVTVVPDPIPACQIGCPQPSGRVRNPGNIIQNQTGFQYGLGGQTISGTQYVAGIQQQRTYNNIAFNAYNPYYIASLNLVITQPLLKDLGMNTYKRQLKLAVVNADANAAQTLVDASTTISKVDDAYWDLVAAWRNVAIQEDALKEAVRQQQSNVRLAKRGAAAPIDVTESTTQVATFQDNVYAALQTVSDLQTELKGLVVTNPSDPIWKANLVPTSPVQQLPDEPDLATMVATAVADRPEVRQALDARRAADIDTAYARNQALPQANLHVGYMSNGFAGIPAPLPQLISAFGCQASGPPSQGGTGKVYCPSVPPVSRGGMAYAYHNLWTGAFPAFNVNFTVSFPLQNDTAKGLKGVATQEEQKANVQTQGVEELIGYQARNALQAYQAAVSRLSTATIARQSAEQVYASELRRFRNGLSTTYLVLQRQVELNQARGRELQAQTDLNKSVVEIQRVEGTILSANGVDLRTIGSQALATGKNP